MCNLFLSVTPSDQKQSSKLLIYSRWTNLGAKMALYFFIHYNFFCNRIRKVHLRRKIVTVIRTLSDIHDKFRSIGPIGGPLKTLWRWMRFSFFSVFFLQYKNGFTTTRLMYIQWTLVPPKISEQLNVSWQHTYKFMVNPILTSRKC